MNSRTHVFKRLALNMTAKDYYWAEKNGWFKWYAKKCVENLLSESTFYKMLNDGEPKGV